MRGGFLALLAAVVAVALLLTGCSNGSASPAPRPSTDRVALPTNDATAGLQRQADLAACPTGAGGGASELPDVTLACLDGGGAVTMSHLTGTPMVVNIWASWCRPCYQEMPAIQQVHADAGSKLVVLGVDTSDDPNRALHAAIDTGVHYPSVYDPQRKVAAGLGRNEQPTTVFVRADGSIAHIRTGPVRDAAQLEALVERYLGVAL